MVVIKFFHSTKGDNMKKNLAISLILFILLIGCNETNTPSIWNGKIDTNWYKESKTEFTIITAEQLAGFAKLVNDGNDFSGKTVKLGRDIILNDTTIWQYWKNNVPAKEWTPIGNYKENSFRGTFDGSGFTVSGIYSNNSKYNQGLFGYVDFSGTIENLNITASYINGEEFINGMVSTKGKIFTVSMSQQLITSQQLFSKSNDNNLNLTVIISKEYFEIRTRGGSLPKISLNDYDELANVLAMIHDRFIDGPDADSIMILVIDDNTLFDKVSIVTDRVVTAGFSVINIAKIEGEELRKYENEQKKLEEKRLRRFSRTESSKGSSGKVSNSQGKLKIGGITNIELVPVDNTNGTGTKVEVSRGNSGKAGNALGNLMGEHMQKERRR
jgi:hypothetical protein